MIFNLMILGKSWRNGRESDFHGWRNQYIAPSTTIRARGSGWIPPTPLPWRPALRRENVGRQKSALFCKSQLDRLDGVEPCPQEFHHRCILLQVIKYKI